MSKIITLPHTQFGRTLEVPLYIYRDGKLLPEETSFDETYWIERDESLYGIPNASKGKNLRVVYRKDWLEAESKAICDDYRRTKLKSPKY